MAKVGKRRAAFQDKVDRLHNHRLDEAIVAVKECATAKFDETIELAFFLGVDPRHAEQMVRGSVSLPHGTGKNVRVIVFCKSDTQVQEAKEMGAIEAGSDELVEKVQSGWTDFDAAVSTPDMMGQVGKLGRVLGPRGISRAP